ncbi:MAG: hypothetical protein WCU74_07975 [Candidatus Omnitrophota bacterium]
MNRMMRSVLVLAIVLSTAFAPSSSPPSSRQGPSYVYQFSEHLAESEASIVIPAREERMAQWDGSQFAFANLSPLFNVQPTTQSFNGEMRPGISILPVPEATRRLRFARVTPGSKMLVYYGFQDTPEDKNALPANVYLAVWAGRHLLARIAVPNKPGWNITSMDLGVATFLLRDIVVTFDITVDEKTKRTLVFNAEILP